MNDAHLHLIVNHFPIMGTIFGLGILMAGIALKNKAVMNIAYILFIISAIFAGISMATGEGAEEIAESLPLITEQVIDQHEEMAEQLTAVLYGLALVSVLGLILNFRKQPKASLISYAAVLIALVALYLGKQTGTTGGEIRHTEIRTATLESTNTVISNAAETDEDD